MSFVIQQVAFDRRFLEKSREWFADAELRNLTVTPPIDPVQQERWFASLPRTGYHLWGIECDGRPAGAFGLKNVADGAGEYWGYIGEKQLWGNGIGHWMIQAALAEARRLKLHRVYLRVLPENTRAVSTYKKNNFNEFLMQDNEGFMLMENIINTV